jgi:hypothetical protein
MQVAEKCWPVVAVAPPRTTIPTKFGGAEGTESIVETLAVFQLARFWLKADATRNALLMDVAKATFQPPMAWLKVDAA